MLTKIETAMRGRQCGAPRRQNVWGGMRQAGLERGNGGGPRGRQASLAVGLAAGAVAAGVGCAGAAEPAWPKEPYSYVVVDQDIRGVLQEFGDHLGLAVDVSDGVTGRVRGKLAPAPPREFLSRLTSMYGLIWYYDGSVLYVVPIKEMISKLLPLGQTPYAALRAELDHLDITDRRFPIRYSSDSNTMLVSGPPRYVELIEQAIAAVNAPRPDTIRIIRGARSPS